MILIIITTALAVIFVSLIVALYLMRKKLISSREAAIATLLASANLLKSIEKYVVALALKLSKSDGKSTAHCIIFK